MKLPASIAAAIAALFCVSVVLPVKAQPVGTQTEGTDFPGFCNITPNKLLATFGSSAAGQALTGNALGLAVGPFSELATATGTSASYDGHGNITGTWTTAIEMNDANGNLTSYNESGTFSVSTSTCTGYFYWNGITTPVFDVVFVNGATEFRAIAVVPGVIIAYTAGSKL
jgi:hypothetical protein